MKYPIVYELEKMLGININFFRASDNFLKYMYQVFYSNSISS